MEDYEIFVIYPPDWFDIYTFFITALPTAFCIYRESCDAQRCRL